MVQQLAFFSNPLIWKWCSNNTITVSLALTVSLKTSDSSCITLSGLVNTQGPSGPSLPITYLSAHNVFGPQAIWNRVAGTLKLTLVSDLGPGSLLIFSFIVTNPSSEQLAASVSIAASGTAAIAAQGMTADSENATSETATVRGDAAPLRIYATTFITRNIGQSTPYPSAVNRLTVTLASTVQLRGAPQDMILFKGLKGSTTPDDISMPIGRHIASKLAATATWDGDIGELSGGVSQGLLAVELHNTSIVEPGESIIFSFILLNPSSAQVAQKVTVTWTGISGFVAQDMSPDNTANQSHPGSVAGDQAPLKIQSSAFVVKSIRQSSVFPWAINVIYVSIVANVELTGNTQAALTISGLLSSTTGQDASFDTYNTLSLTYSAGSPSIFGLNGSWTRETGQLLLQMVPAASHSAGQTCAFSFELRNPGKNNHESASISIRSSSSSALLRLPVVAMDMMPLALLNFTGSVGGDALPLRVKSPSFILARFHQSTTYPG